MTDRVIVYPGQTPLETDLLQAQRFALLGLGGALAAVLGTTTLVDGLACAATTVPSLAVQVAPGAIYSLQNVDGTPYSSLPADTAHQTVKQALLPDVVTLATPAPPTAGQSVIHLIQAAYADQDVNPVVLPYYNSTNPALGYTGPNGSGTAQNTVRKGVCLVTAKAGTAAVSPSVPAPDPGYVGLYTVTVANGQSTVTAVNIAQQPAAPFIAEKLTQKLSKATADAYYGPNHGQCRLALSGGSITLLPYNGNRLVVNGAMVAIPAAGVALSATTAASTTYYVYAYLNGSGVLTLEASTTGHATHTNGVEVKSGDPTRTLVGMARTTAANAWADTYKQRFVLNWFNRKALDCRSDTATAVTTASATLVELSATARHEFLTWGDEAVTVAAVGFASNNAAGGAYVQSACGVDGSVYTPAVVWQSATAGYSAPFNASLPVQLSEGYRSVTAFGSANSGGTGAWTTWTHSAVRG